MTLNQDCLRDVLLQVEAAGLSDYISEETLHTRLPQYTEDEICYACYMLGDAGYLDIQKLHYIRKASVEVHGLTYRGHGFLDQIRDVTVWGKVKAQAKKMGAIALPALADIAKEVIAAKLTG
jgi:hypothetical protein